MNTSENVLHEILRNGSTGKFAYVVANMNYLFCFLPLKDFHNSPSDISGTNSTK